jgi:hypothetical protein
LSTARTQPEQGETATEVVCRSEDVVELSLLLHEAQFDALEQVARSSGLTPAELLRRLVGKFLREER